MQVIKLKAYKATKGWYLYSRMSRKAKRIPPAPSIPFPQPHGGAILNLRLDRDDFKTFMGISRSSLMKVL